MMADVACFCGCLYSFHGGAGACPECGEDATVITTAASASAGRSHQHSQPWPGLRLGEVVCVPGLHDPSMIDTVNEAQRTLLLTAVSSGLAHRYAPGPGA